MENGPRQKPPPPPILGSAKPATAGRTPAAEGVMVRPGGVSAALMERMRALLPQSARNSLSVDMSGNVIAAGQRIGVHERSRFLIDHGPLFSHIPFPAAMRAMAQAKGLVVFIEVTESEASICAGSALGQKMVYSRLS
jgi:hypothetical protein